MEIDQLVVLLAKRVLSGESRDHEFILYPEDGIDVPEGQIAVVSVVLKPAEEINE